MKKIDLSLLVLTRNEENNVEENLIKIRNYLENLSLLNKYEIIVSDYSEDSTLELVKNLSTKFSNINPQKAPRKGIGCGLVTAVSAAQYPYLMFYPIDLAWDIQIIENSIKKIIEGYNVVLGSRNVKGSKIQRPIKRRISSKCYNFLMNFLFQLSINDSQGTCAFKKSDYIRYEKHLTDDGPFLQTELLIYSKKLGLKIIEIPSIVHDMRNDSLSFIGTAAVDIIIKAFKKKFHLIFNSI